MIKQKEDPCGKKTVYTPQGLKGDKGDPGVVDVDYAILSPQTRTSQNVITGYSVIPSLPGTGGGATLPFDMSIDRQGFNGIISVSIETPPAGATNFLIANFNHAGKYGGASGGNTIYEGESKSNLHWKVGFRWDSIPLGAHDVVLKFYDPFIPTNFKLHTVKIDVVSDIPGEGIIFSSEDIMTPNYNLTTDTNSLLPNMVANITTDAWYEITLVMDTLVTGPSEAYYSIRVGNTDVEVLETKSSNASGVESTHVQTIVHRVYLTDGNAVTVKGYTLFTDVNNAQTVRKANMTIRRETLRTEHMLNI